MPEPVIKGGFASQEGVAHIATQKFVMGSPLYRQEQEWAQNGILLCRQTMSNWLIKACEDWLEPIYEEMKRRLCKHQVLHADETTLQVLHEDGKPAQSKSYMWLFFMERLARRPTQVLTGQGGLLCAKPAQISQSLFAGRSVKISNNRAENSIRPFVMGRKNWLFSNAPNGARASAIYYSLIISARENGFVPFEYLTKVFTNAPNGANLESLLPWCM